MSATANSIRSASFTGFYWSFAYAWRFS